ncbi:MULTISPECIES: PhoX family phosphatase [unclassified Neptuniibacter]|uniref:PhoX family protein n=1 Tax=unclassified Neptuniibacter TaxID=2630693 RepID=UPI000C3DF1E2|nr:MULTISPECIES: PhoX family phosphatase [unclassified Neptuniibacter]MAY41143.1 transcriptional initiation protein Tat [Oceanospirillaceae bacterium]|tara:strand:- start:7836 stop:9758 length:1923 start_codon:yes stop_codon:yes gene_type:complete
MGYDNSHDICSNLKNEQDSEFTRMTDKVVSRRGFMAGMGALGLGAFIGLSPIAKSVQAAMSSSVTSKLIGFKPVPASTADSVVVPEGYKATNLISWGDPIFANAPEFDPSGKAPASSQAQQFGDNTDGMTLFPLSDDRAVMAVNNEYTNNDLLFDHKGESMTANDVKKAQNAHGVSVFEIKKTSKGWEVDRSGKLNRRITANTPMQLTGPAAGHDLLKTAADPSGVEVLGTFNNCANGETPWGTYLTCEENFHNYFGTPDESYDVPAEQKRYGIKPADKRYQWSKFDERFDLAKNPNEPNRHGWVVEIDPKNPESKPQKRTALGRFKHENAALMIESSGHVVVYLGDDERGEHLYKFVSKGKYDANNQANNRKLLDEGTLYVAKFTANEGELKGKGHWIELTFGKNGLTPENGFNSQAEVLIHTRLAATQVGGTTMDRPEWVAIHPSKKSAFCTLTNNKNRGNKDNQPIGGPNPRGSNKYGQIVRWMPANGNHTTAEFDWDLYVIAGNPSIHKEGLLAGSSNVTSENMFNSPDGLGFDNAGRMWIMTDGKYSNKDDFAGMGNNQMLCGDPETREIHRFLAGPIACEVTGLTFTPDQKTMFVGIQHPGEKGKPSHFPEGGESKPRSTIVMITREDGGVIGA